MPNVNEMHRQMMEEREEILDALTMPPFKPKGQKEGLLRRLRVLERELDIEGSSYNTEDFDK